MAHTGGDRSVRGQIVHLNHAARALLERSDSLRCDANKLGTVAGADTARLHAQISRAIYSYVEGVELRSTTCTISAADGGRLAAVIFPLKPENSAILGEGEEENAYALVTIFDLREAEVAIRPGILPELFGLTVAEERVAILGAIGHSPTKIGELSNLAMPTVRTHLSRIYQKTETGTQRNLMRLLSGLGTLNWLMPESELAPSYAGKSRRRNTVS